MNNEESSKPFITECVECGCRAYCFPIGDIGPVCTSCIDYEIADYEGGNDE